MAKTRQQKEEAVKQLTEKLSRAKSVVFADYTGMTMSELSDLRSKLREQQAEFSVTKNSLLGLALKDSDYALTDDNVILGQTATMMAFEDEISPIKTVVTGLKSINKGKVKGGFLGSEFVDQYKVVTLSNLPSKQELRGKTVGVLVAPLHGIVGVLQANIRNLVYVVDAIKKQKGGE